MIGPSYLYGSISRPVGFSGLEFMALNQYRFKCWDGGGMNIWLAVNGPGGLIDIGGEGMGVAGANDKTPKIGINGVSHQIKMHSSAPGSSTLTERFRLSQSGINFTGLSTHTGNFDLDGDIDVDGHTNLDNVSISGFTTFADASSTTGRLYFGDDQDMQMWHSGSDGIIYNNTGSMYIGAFSGNGITIQSNRIYLKNAANNETYLDCYQNARVGLYFNNEEKLRTTDTGIRVGTGVTVETNGQATFTGIVTATSFKLANGSDVGTGAGGTWSSYTAGIATSKSVGVNTSTLDDNDLVGVGNSFQGLYISNGMIIHDNTLSGNHYIGTAFNGLMAGPVNIEGTLSVDGSYVVV